MNHALDNIPVISPPPRSLSILRYDGRLVKRSCLFFGDSSSEKLSSLPAASTTWKYVVGDVSCLLDRLHPSWGRDKRQIFFWWYQKRTAQNFRQHPMLERFKGDTINIELISTGWKLIVARCDVTADLFCWIIIYSRERNRKLISLLNDTSL